LATSVHLIDVTDFTLPDGSRSADWFRSAFETLGIAGSIELTVHDGTRGDFPDPVDAAGVGRCLIVSGSSGAVFEDKPWIPGLLDFLRKAHAKSSLILGVCFGHHALATALGGEVRSNPRGREMGTVPVYLTPEGARSKLFSGFGSGDLMSLVHKTHVTRLPEGAVRLAYNQMTPVQAFRVGRSFGIQPHPEMTPVELEQLSRMFEEVLIRKERFLDDTSHLDDFIDSFRDSPSARSILGNFVSMAQG